MNVLGLFSGIGGFELGFQRAGFTIAAMCEVEPYARAVLTKQFPGVPIHGDIRHLRGRRGEFDVITGGFPCQDISLAGKGAGLTGERSGLWSEYRRLIDEIRPAWVVIENVSALRSRGLDEVLRQLTEIGYDAEWHCVPASAIGAPHRRDRVWIVAYAQGAGAGLEAREAHGAGWRAAEDEREGVRPGNRRASDVGLAASCRSEAVADALGAGLEGRARLAGYLARQLAAAQRGGAGEDVADASGDVRQPWRPGDASGGARGRHADRGVVGSNVSDERGAGAQPRHNDSGGCGWAADWLTEPNVGRVANGVPSRVDRLRALGNAVVPQIPEALAWAIRQWEFFDG